MALVSILIPCYNAVSYLGTTIQSVIEQSYLDWELIIVDDCSTDGSYEVALQWEQKDTRIKTYRNQQNLGMVGNWNAGIKLCHSPFFVKLDADDIWYKTMLETAMKVLQENPEVGLVFSRFENIDEKGNVFQTSVELPEFVRNQPFSCVPLVQQGPDKMLAYKIMLQGLSVMRREVFDKIGTYRYLLTKETQAATDTEFYFRVGAHYKIFYIDEVLYQYRVHETSLSVVDIQKKLSNKKIYEIKYCIIKYYLQCGLITKNKAIFYLKIINRQYSFSKIAQYLHEKKWGKMFSTLIQQVVKDPVSTLFFYYKRVFNKFPNI